MATTEQIIKRLSKLQSTLLTSGLSQTNQPLFQVINQLIQAVIDSAAGVVEINDNGGGSGTISDKTYLTVGNELASLPQSSQLVAGDNVSFDTSTFGQLVIDVLLSFITNATVLTTGNETGNFPNSRRLLAGTNINFSDATPGQRTINASFPTPTPDRTWSVLTNGNATNPELIYVGGDVIMTHVP